MQQQAIGYVRVSTAEQAAEGVSLDTPVPDSPRQPDDGSN